jgi:hypothetical protein
MDLYKTRYASMEREGDGYAVYNDVTGLYVDTYRTQVEAKRVINEITQRYSAIGRHYN